ncbi:MAG: glycoside hydrolase family 15 protein [Thermoplasmatales archaeon]
MPVNSKFPLIEDHGVLLNNRTAALVSKEGEIDFACFPNFDSDMVFSSILDRERGGYFIIKPVGNGIEGRQYYEPDTNILFTVFYQKGERILSVMDFLPMSHENYVYFSEIHRRIEAFRDVKVSISFRPFFSESRKGIKKIDHSGYMSYSDNSTQFLSTTVDLEVNDDEVFGNIELPETEVLWMVTAHNLKKAYPPSVFSSELRLWQTRKFWKEWLLKSTYQGIFYDVVNRSLLTIKGLFFDPKGFMVASPTTSLPESIGGERNWDYRFMWVRDTAYAVDSLIQLGYLDEATRFYLSIIDRFEKDGRLYSVYGITDDALTDEKVLNYSGYENSKPVRVGNAARSQLQIDQYASLITSLKLILENSGFISTHMLEKVFLLGDSLMRIWNLPDSSIWEIRGKRRHYVYSKALAWKGLSDLAWIYNILGDQSSSRLAKNEAKRIAKEILEKGVSRSGYLSQSYNSEELDASLLRLPLIGFCSVTDPLYVRTFREIEGRLMPERYLFRRYTLDDGLKGSDNAFLLLSFWYIRNLIRMSRLEEAHEGIMKLLNIGNNLYLFPEEIEFGTHRYLGNYPQGLSHFALIQTIYEYNKALSAGK